MPKATKAIAPQVTACRVILRARARTLANHQRRVVKEGSPYATTLTASSTENLTSFQNGVDSFSQHSNSPLHHAFNIGTGGNLSILPSPANNESNHIHGITGQLTPPNGALPGNFVPMARSEPSGSIEVDAHRRSHRRSRRKEEERRARQEEREARLALDRERNAREAEQWACTKRRMDMKSKMDFAREILADERGDPDVRAKAKAFALRIFDDD